MENENGIELEEKNNENKIKNNNRQKKKSSKYQRDLKNLDTKDKDTNKMKIITLKKK